MPKLLEESGIKFFFYLNDHEPAHVHAENSDGTAKLVLGDKVSVALNKGIKPRDLKRALEIAETHKGDFKAAWNKHMENSK
jgi:hypothetical protein